VITIQKNTDLGLRAEMSAVSLEGDCLVGHRDLRDSGAAQAGAMQHCNIHDKSLIPIPILVKHRISTEYIKAGLSAGFEIFKRYFVVQVKQLVTFHVMINQRCENDGM